MDNIFNILQNINSIQNRNEHINQLLKNEKITSKLAPGIINGENICFHNSAMQLLFRITEMKDMLVSQDILKKFKDSNVYGILNLLKIMNDESGNFNKIRNNPINNKKLLLAGVCPFTRERGNWGKLQLKLSIKTYLTGMIDYLKNKCNLEHLNPLYESDSFDEEINNSIKFLENVNESPNSHSSDEISNIIIGLYNNVCNEKTENVERKRYLLSRLIKLNSLVNSTPIYGQHDAQEFLLLVIMSITKECDSIAQCKEPSHFLEYESNKYFCKIKDENNMANVMNYIAELEKSYENCSTSGNWSHITERGNIYNLQILPTDNGSMTDILRDDSERPINRTISGLKQGIYIGIGLGSSYGTKYIYFEKHIMRPNKYFIVQLNIEINEEKFQHAIPLADLNGSISIYDGKNKVIYYLIGFIVHIGKDLDTGHYISYIENDGKWYRYNDDIVEEINTKPIWNHAYINNETPYTLLYQQM